MSETEWVPDPSAARALVDAVRFFHRKGWCPATSSNFSIGSQAQMGCWISQSGVDKGAFGPEHLMAVDLDGHVRASDARKPSAETLLHTLIYQTRASARSVLHIHAPFSVVMSRAYEEVGRIRLAGWELLKGFSGVTSHETTVEVPIFPNHQDMKVLAGQIAPVLEAKPKLCAFLLSGHGLYAWGDSVFEARRHAEVTEALLEQAYLWRNLA